MWKDNTNNYAVRDYLLGGGWERERYKDSCIICEHIPMHTKEVLGDVHELNLGNEWSQSEFSRLTSFRESGITEFVQSCRSLGSVILHKRTYRVRVC